MPAVSEGEALDLLGRARVARLATTDAGGRPHLVPIVFAIEGHRLVTSVDRKPKRSRSLRRLDNIAANPAASVLADHYEEDWTRLWWVRADGTASVSGDVEAVEWAARLLGTKYPQHREAPPPGPIIVVEVERVTGWRASG